MLARESGAPAAHRKNYGKHFLYLDVLLAVTAGAFGREPLLAKMSTKAFGASSVSVRVEDGARG